MRNFMSGRFILILAMMLFSAFAGYNMALLAGRQAVDVENAGERLEFSGGGFEADIDVPAVDQSGQGTVSRISVRAMQGTGQILADINSVLFFVDTQNSIRVAKEVAQNYTGIDLSRVDLVFSVHTNASVIEGPSAGAALAVATIAALVKRQPRENILITGVIYPDGRIGAAGGIEKKAAAAKRHGAVLFLVPQGNIFENGFEKIRSCGQYEGFAYCETNYTPKGFGLDGNGLKVSGVSNINDALKYFIGGENG